MMGTGYMLRLLIYLGRWLPYTMMPQLHRSMNSFVNDSKMLSTKKKHAPQHHYWVESMLIIQGLSNKMTNQPHIGIHLSFHKICNCLVQEHERHLLWHCEDSIIRDDSRDRRGGRFKLGKILSKIEVLNFSLNFGVYFFGQLRWPSRDQEMLQVPQFQESVDNAGDPRAPLNC